MEIISRDNINSMNSAICASPQFPIYLCGELIFISSGVGEGETKKGEREGEEHFYPSTGSCPECMQWTEEARS